jgi:EmrB/QacA subfamily drug resistance transporter
VLVAQVDTAVANLGTNPIAAHFGAGVDQMQWVVDGYNLAYAALLLTGGLLADLYGRRRVFVAGAALFTVASLVCTFAPSVAVLIAGRALAGIGAGLMMPASLALVRVLWRDPAERTRALGVWAACNGIALAIGPTVGGLLIQTLGWRSMFVVVVPLSLAAGLLAPRFIPESADPEGRRFDAVAQVCGALALGGFAFAAIAFRGAPATALVAIAVAAVALGLFIRIEARRGASALVPLDIFGIRVFRATAVATVGMTFGMYGALFVVPLYWQQTGRLDAFGAGLGLLPLALGFVLVSPLSGSLANRYGARLVACGGVAVVGCGQLCIAASAGQPGILLAGIGLALTGLGMGFATGPLMATAVGAVAAVRSGTASSLINVVRMTGATLGVAMLGAVFATAPGADRGLGTAMLLGGLVELGCAAIAFRAMAPASRDQPSGSMISREVGE